MSQSFRSPRPTRRSLLVAASAGAALAVIGCAAVPKQTPIVLVHGAWMGAASWDNVAANLRARGLQVTAVELPGHGKDATPPGQLKLQGYVDAVIAALPAQGQAVVVGHSMAGIVISAVAEQAPERIARLVYVAAYLPLDGESLYKLAMSDADSRVGKYWHQDDPKAYTPATIKREGIVEVFCADCSGPDQRFLIDTHRAEAVPPLGTPVKLTAANFGRVPRTYVLTLRDQAVSTKLQRTMLAATGGTTVVVELDSSHAPMLAQPRALADIIATAGR